jgi:Ca2+-binding EF-hand superfamily protein
MSSHFDKKILRYFQILDINNDNILNESDILAAIQNLMASEGYLEGSPRAQRAAEITRGIYGPLLNKADSNQDGAVTSDEFIAYWNQVLAMLQANDPAIQPVLDNFQKTVELIFDALDRNKDGRIEFKEYDRFLSSYRGMIAFDRMDVFRALDIDGNGSLSKDEVHQTFREYFLMDEAQARGNWIYGKF